MSAQILAAIGNVLFVAVVFTIATRLMLLWRRTREWPEFLISSGLLLLALLGVPLFAASGIGGERIDEVSLPLLAGGLTTVAISIVLIQSFTWRVFRPTSRWAAGFVVATGITALGVAALFLKAVIDAPPDASPVDVHAPWSVAIRLLFEVWYVWMGAESLIEWSRARRRMAIGLSDPVVTNRFLLWGSMGVLLAINGVVAMAFEAHGLTPINDALPALWLGMNGVIAGSLMFMTFVPPRRYRAWIRSRYQERLLG